jgi:hypothetical protein
MAGRTVLYTETKLLHSEIVLSWKLIGIGHMYITLLLRMTNIMTSQNTDLSVWDILCMYVCMYVCIYIYLFIIIQYIIVSF